MVPIDYELMVLEDHSKTDIFMPMEQLNCQSISDFIQRYPQHVKHMLTDYKEEKTREGIHFGQMSLIDKFLSKEQDEDGKIALQKTFEDEGLIRHFGELSTDLYLSNPIERCFITKSKTFFDYLNPIKLCKKKKI